MSGRDEDTSRKLEEMSDRQVKDYLRRSSLTFLECAIALLVTNLGVEETAEILDDEARLLRDHG